MPAPAAANVAARCSHGCARWTRTGSTCSWLPPSSSKGCWRSPSCCRTRRRGDGLVAVLVAGLAGCVAIRRRAPVVAALVGMLLFLAFPAAGQEYTEHLVSPFFVVLLLVYGIGRHLEGRAVWAVTACAAVLMSAFTAIERPTTRSATTSSVSARWWWPRSSSAA